MGKLEEYIDIGRTKRQLWSAIFLTRHPMLRVPGRPPPWYLMSQVLPAFGIQSLWGGFSHSSFCRTKIINQTICSDNCGLIDPGLLLISIYLLNLQKFQMESILDDLDLHQYCYGRDQNQKRQKQKREYYVLVQLIKHPESECHRRQLLPFMVINSLRPSASKTCRKERKKGTEILICRIRAGVATTRIQVFTSDEINCLFILIKAQKSLLQTMKLLCKSLAGAVRVLQIELC